MSINVPAVDLSAATNGTTGTARWSGLGVDYGAPVGVSGKRPIARIYNESGCGLKYTLGTRGDRLPAGAWADAQLNGEDHLDYTVEYVLTGQPVSLLLIVIYQPGEPMPAMPTLGNSPIGVGGQVATSGTGGTDHILNSNNPPATSTYSTTPNDQSGASISDTNDGAGFRKILSANVLRTVWNIVRGNATTGKASIQIGDSGDTSLVTVYGTASAAQSLNNGVTSSDNGTAQLFSTVNARGIALGYKDSGGTYHQVLTINPDGTVSAAGALHATADTANALAAMTAGVENANVVLRPQPTTDPVVIQTNDGANAHNFYFTANGALNFPFLGSISGLNRISGSGSATVNHGLTATPDAAVVNTANGSNSTTFGSGSYGPSTVYIYQYIAQSWVGMVYRA